MTKNICDELFLKKLAASVLALLLNANYLLAGYELISKKKMIHVKWKNVYVLILFWNYKQSTDALTPTKQNWWKLPISKSLLLQGCRDNNFMIAINQVLVPRSKVW